MPTDFILINPSYPCYQCSKKSGYQKKSPHEVWYIEIKRSAKRRFMPPCLRCRQVHLPKAGSTTVGNRRTNATTLFYRYVFYLCIMSESKQIRDQNVVHLLPFRVADWGRNEMIESRIEPIHQNHVRAGIVEYEYLYLSARNFSELNNMINNFFND